MSTMSELLLSISHCEEVEKALNDSIHECHEIVSFQKGEKRHLPEPWNGDINTADILFISSNPSYCDKETAFPDKHSDNDYIIDFFLKRFEDPQYNSPFIKGIKKCASWLLNNSDPAIIKKKICCTNIVHCKSTSQKGVKKSCKKCSEKWIAKVLQEFHGEYIFVIGRIAQKMIDENLLKQRPNVKKVLFVPHPSGWTRNRYTDAFIRDSIIEALNNDDMFSDCYRRKSSK